MKPVFVLLAALLLVACSPAGVEPAAGQVVSTPAPDTATPAALATVAPANTPVPPSPTVAAPTPRPTVTDSPPPPTYAPTTVGQTSVEFGFAWIVPVGWPEVTGQAAAEEGVLFQQAWANDENAAQLLAGSPPQLQDTLMVLSARVRSEADSLFPPPDSTLQRTAQDQQVAARTISGAAAAPFSLRLSYTIARSPYHYTLELGCLFSAEADSAARAAANCQDTWQRISWQFGLCPLPGRPISSPESWQTVANAYYGYSFEIPAEWYEQEYRTADRREFVTDLVVLTQPRTCRKPNGIMGLRLSADPPGNFLPADGPDRTGYTQLLDKPFPAWIDYYSEAEVGVEGVTTASILIQGSFDWYGLMFQCHAPSGAGDADKAAFQTQCDAVLAHILDSFQVAP